MKQTVLLVLALGLFAACIYFFLLSAGHLSVGEYLAGTLHILVGFGLSRAGSEMARLAIISRPRPLDSER